MLNTEGFEKRILYNAAKKYSAQLKKGDNFELLNLVIANEANFGERELDLQHRKRDWVYIQKSSLELAKKQGLEQGIEQEKIQMVINAHKANLDMKLIQHLTGFSLAEVEKIIGEYQ